MHSHRESLLTAPPARHTPLAQHLKLGDTAITATTNPAEGSLQHTSCFYPSYPLPCLTLVMLTSGATQYFNWKPSAGTTFDHIRRCPSILHAVSSPYAESGATRELPHPWHRLGPTCQLPSNARTAPNTPRQAATSPTLSRGLETGKIYITWRPSNHQP